MKDTLTRFIFEDLPVRGLMVQLNETWKTLQSRKDYPEVVRKILGEFAAANILLASSLKLQGSMTMQIRGNGPISLLVMDCNHKHEIRGLAHSSEIETDGNLDTLFGSGQLVITIDNQNSAERYQGIVELSGEQISQALENYLEKSEQLATKLVLAVNDDCAAGILIQKLPGEILHDEDDWSRIIQLTDTLQAEELLNLDSQQILHRLFNEDRIRLLGTDSCSFHCTCSKERVSNMLVSLGKQEIDEIIKEQGGIEVNCEFCNQRYYYDKIDAETLFTDPVSRQTSKSKH